MKKFYLGALFVLAIATVHAQPGGGMFGGMPKIDVTFNEYVAAPEGFDKETAGIERGTMWRRNTSRRLWAPHAR